MLNEANAKWPDRPVILFNLALAALGARRAGVTLEAVTELEKQWQDNPAIAADYHDDAMTARGLALLLEEKTSGLRCTGSRRSAQSQVNCLTEPRRTHPLYYRRFARCH